MDPRPTTVVRVQCPTCGPVPVRPADILLSLHPAGATYVFTCGCGKRTAVQASPATVASLRATACKVQEITLPPRPLRSAPPISADELLDMLLELRRPGWEAAFNELGND